MHRPRVATVPVGDALATASMTLVAAGATFPTLATTTAPAAGTGTTAPAAGLTGLTGLTGLILWHSGLLVAIGFIVHDAHGVAY